MGFKGVVLALALMGCLTVTASCQGPGNYINEPAFPTEEMSGSQIYKEVRQGEYTDPNESQLSFRNESLFIIRKDTGMTPGVPQRGVRTPAVVITGLGPAPAAGSWYFTLTDVATRYLKLNLNQNLDAVFGSGELIEGSTAIPVTAGGTVLGDQLAMFVIPVGSQYLYRFSLALGPGSMNGDYIYSGPGVTQPGVAFGSIVAPLGAQALQAAQTPQMQQVQQAQQTQQTQQGY